MYSASSSSSEYSITFCRVWVGSSTRELDVGWSSCMDGELSPVASQLAALSSTTDNSNVLCVLTEHGTSFTVIHLYVHVSTVHLNTLSTGATATGTSDCPHLLRLGFHQYSYTDWTSTTTELTYLTLCITIFGWLRSTVGRTSVFGRRTDPVLRSACSWRVTTMWVNRPLQVSQPGQLSLSSSRGR